MSPQKVRAFDKQATACARVQYFEDDVIFQGALEIGPDLVDATQATPLAGATEATCWEHSWNTVAFGLQHEIDLAEKGNFTGARRESAVSGKGIRTGKDQRHWTAPFIYSSSSEPYPLELSVRTVQAVAFCWGEYASKMAPEQQVGDFKAATFKGPPILGTTPPTNMAPPAAVPKRAKAASSGKGS